MRVSPSTLRVAAGFLAVFVPAGAGAAESDAFHYRVEVRIDPASHQLEATARIQNPPASRFYLHTGLSIHRLTADGETVPFRRDADGEPLPFTLVPPVEVDAKDVRLLQVEYGGAIDEVVSGVNMITPDLVELAYYAVWFPTFEGMENFSFELEVDVPRGFVLTTTRCGSSILPAAVGATTALP